MVKLYRLIVVALALALAACGSGFGASIDDDNDDGSSPVPAQHRQPTEPKPEIPGGPGPTIPPVTGNETLSICYICCINSGGPPWLCNGDEPPQDDDGGGYDPDQGCWWDGACRYYGDCCDG